MMLTKSRIKLPADPTDLAYEDLICAVLMAQGYFTESSITFKLDKTEAFEFDLVATPSGGPVSQRFLVEAKSGKSGNGFGELWKLYGQRMFTGIDEAYLVRRKPLSQHQQEHMDTIGRQIDVHTCCFNIGNEDSTESPWPECRDLNEELSGAVFSTVRWLRFADRRSQRSFVDKMKSESDKFGGAREYDREVRGTFFARSPLKRVQGLYNAYGDYPKMSGTVAEEAFGRAAQEKIQESWGTSKYPWLQYCMATEHRARIWIIQNAVEHCRTKSKGDAAKSWSERLSDGWEGLMPDNFLAGVRELETNEHRQKIPYLFQVFLDVLGGFYVAGNRHELELLGSITAIPTDEVEDCLKLYDVIFPIPYGWFYDHPTGVRMLKMVPGYIRGAGCFFRNSLDEDAYESLLGKGSWLLSNWHNALFHLLKPELEVQIDE